MFNPCKLWTSVIAALSTQAALAGPVIGNIRELEVRVWTAEDSQIPGLEKEVTQLLQVDPRSVAAHQLLSHVFVRLFTRDPSDIYILRQAADLAQQAVDLAPSDPAGYAALADILDLMGNTEGAVKLLTQAEAKGIKPNWRFAFTRARLIADNGGGEKVLSLLRQALSQPGAETRIIVPYIVAILQSDDTGRQLITKLDQWNNNFPSPLFDLTLAITYTELGEFQKAHNIYNHMLSTNAPNTEAEINNAIIMYRDLNQPKKASVLLESVLAKHKDELSSNLRATITGHLGAAYVRQSDWERAKKSFVIAIAVEKENQNLIDFIGRTYKQANAPAKLALLLTELNNGPNGHGILHAMLGETLSEKLHRHDEAVHAYTDAIILDPNRSDFYTGMGLALYRKKSYSAALKVFGTAAELDPNDPISRYNQACVLALLGRSDESLNSLAEAITLDPRLAATAKLDHDFSGLNNSAKFRRVLQDSPAIRGLEFDLAH